MVVVQAADRESGQPFTALTECIEDLKKSKRTDDGEGSNCQPCLKQHGPNANDYHNTAKDVSFEVKQLNEYLHFRIERRIRGQPDPDLHRISIPEELDVAVE